jgi:hypothetical protein
MPFLVLLVKYAFHGSMVKYAFHGSMVTTKTMKIEIQSETTVSCEPTKKVLVTQTKHLLFWPEADTL